MMRRSSPEVTGAGEARLRRSWVGENQSMEMVRTPAPSTWLSQTVTGGVTVVSIGWDQTASTTVNGGNGMTIEDDTIRGLGGNGNCCPKQRTSTTVRKDDTSQHLYFLVFSNGEGYRNQLR